MHETVLRPDPIIKAVHGAFCRGVSRVELLETAATKILEVDARYAGVYMYVVRGSELALEVAVGRPATVSSVPAGRPIESDLSVTIRLHEHILGAIAIEGEVPGGFGEAEEHAVHEVADALAVLL